jgi:hypothetical protein
MWALLPLRYGVPAGVGRDGRVFVGVGIGDSAISVGVIVACGVAVGVAVGVNVGSKICTVGVGSGDCAPAVFQLTRQSRNAAIEMQIMNSKLRRSLGRMYNLPVLSD